MLVKYCNVLLVTSDGIIRVFSAEPNRQADASLQQQFAEEVAQTSLSAKQELGGIKISEYVL
jgi:hypothetical protein